MNPRRFLRGVGSVVAAFVLVLLVSCAPPDEASGDAKSPSAGSSHEASVGSPPATSGAPALPDLDEAARAFLRREGGEREARIATESEPKGLALEAAQLAMRLERFEVAEQFLARARELSPVDPQVSSLYETLHQLKRRGAGK